MKKFFLTLSLFCYSASMVLAQSVISIQPQPASINNDTKEDISADAVIHNLTNNIIHMKWERQVIEITPGCETAVCDPNTCYARFVDTKPFDMDPNAEGELLVHFYRNGSPCAGIVHVVVTNLDDANDVTTGVYMYNQSSGTDDLTIANVKLFPNPVTEYFSLENAENVGSIRVYSLDSKEIIRFEPDGSNVYSVQNIPAGNYVIALSDKKGLLFQALEFSKK
ncbi:MAG: T9SS type A sorting domain-containing protein [Lewinellaceae bacterium]|nr:T9SS type A sorting domain-containing protein [Saprospiraceae bacterium]MCB9343821.1 T9SS type A sorting domain-containing protein [Lewinellaceae bacterium]